jgi:hypothetical protein
MTSVQCCRLVIRDLAGQGRRSHLSAVEDLQIPASVLASKLLVAKVDSKI